MRQDISLRQRIGLELQRHINNDIAREHTLRQLFWECTLRCNMKCRHCGSDCRTVSDIQDMPFEDFRKVLVSISAGRDDSGNENIFDPHRIMVILTGGEPLMREDICRCGREIYDLGFPWGIVSNGRLMSPQKIENLLRAGMHSATISLDGFEEEHNWMRGTADGFRHAVNAIAILASETTIKFDVVTCVNKRNHSRLREFRDFLVSTGVRRWRLFTVFPAGRAAYDPEMNLDKEQFRELMEFISETRKDGMISASYGCEGFLGGYEGKVRDTFFSCQAGISVASVLADGSISACPSIRADYSQGNIYKDDFVKIWSRGYEKFRNRDWMKTGLCSECRYFRYCQGNGMHLRDGDGNLLLCHMEKLGGIRR